MLHQDCKDYTVKEIKRLSLSFRIKKENGFSCDRQLLVVIVIIMSWPSQAILGLSLGLGDDTLFHLLPLPGLLFDCTVIIFQMQRFDVLS